MSRRPAGYPNSAISGRRKMAGRNTEILEFMHGLGLRLSIIRRPTPEHYAAGTDYAQQSEADY